MTLYGIGLVARQEIRTRLRTGRWRLLLGIWFAVVNGLGLLFRIALESENGGGSAGNAVPMFGGVLLGVLVLTLLVAPALGAQSINGERERGTLAALQITRLAPGDIVLGKLAAAWGTGLLVLLLTLPCALVPVLEGEIGVGRAVVTITVTGLLIGIVCAVSLGWSAAVARSITSVLLSYLTVFGLLVGTPLVFAMALPLTKTQVRTEHLSFSRTHPERVWWLLAPNPVVILADAAPRQPPPEPRETGTGYGDDHYVPEPFDPLGDTQEQVREIRSASSDEDRAGPVWPYGLVAGLGMAGGALWTASRRLRTPVRAVAPGTRIA
ncbi:ABC transporter permease subunit [Spirillospora sp. NPDC029432]|uniref:ABC transporter permease n=1 Tax=Spirillospora sp. NPDC029432 TaxID=3154599 RepID=UPI003451ACFA